MKIKHLFLSLLAVATVAAAGCTKDKSNEKPSLKLDPSSLEFEAVTGTKTVKVDANQAWEIDEFDADWVTLSKTEGDGAAEIEVSVLANSGAAREAKITFRCSIVKKTLTITQNGAGGTIEEGDGTEAKPYSASQALGIAEKLASDATTDKEVYVKGIVSDDPDIDTSSYGNATFSISDDGTATNAFTIYRCYSFNGEKFTDANTVKKGDVVVVWGKLINYKGDTPEMNQGGRLISVNGDAPVVETVTVEGVVVAASGMSFIVKDAKDGLNLVYGKDAAGKVKVGDTVSVEGVEGEHNGTPQITSPTVAVKSHGVEVSYPKATVLTGSNIESYTTVLGYVELSGTLSISKGSSYDNYNIVIDGTTIHGTIAAPVDDISGLDGVPVTVSGYYLYLSKSSTTTYFNILATKVESAGSYLNVTPTSIDVAAAATSATINVKSNVAWTAVSETEGFTIDNTSGNGDATITVTFAANTDTAAKTATVKVTTTDTNIEEVDRTVTVTINQSAAPSGNELIVVLDATGNVALGDLELNKDYSNTKLTTTIDGYSWTFFAGTKFRLYDQGYFLWGQKDAYILMPAVEGKSLSKVTILTGKKASTAVQVGVYDAEGKDAVPGGSAITLNATDKEFSWTLTGTTANTSYQLRVCNAKNAQLQKLTLVYE